MSLLLLFGTGGSAGTAGATTTTGSSGVPVVAGREYLITAEFRTAVTARTCAVGVQWFDSGGSIIRSVISPSVTDSTTAWTQAHLEAVAPTGAAFAAVFVQIYGCAAAEVHYIDKIGLLEPSIWVLPE